MSAGVAKMRSPSGRGPRMSEGLPSICTASSTFRWTRLKTKLKTSVAQTVPGLELRRGAVKVGAWDTLQKAPRCVS
eukprot:7283450-Pyramimonas_sp.AAC.1